MTLTTYAPPFSQVGTGYSDLSGGNILGRWTRVFREGDDVQVQAFYDRTNRHELNFGDLRDTFDIDYLQRAHWGSQQHLSWGLGVRASRGDELEVVSGLFFDPRHQTDKLYSAFLQDDVTVVPDRLTLEVGTKLLKTNYTGAEFEPSARLLWTPTDTQTLWLAFTRALRTPSDGERDFFLSGFIGTLDGLPFFARFNANRNFRSEKMASYEAGYRRLIGRDVYVDLAAFMNQYHDLFSEELAGPIFTETVPAPTHFLLPAQFGNSLRGNTAGGEIAPEWRPMGFWRLRGSYSFLHMTIEKAPGSLDVGSAPRINGSSPQHQLMLQSSFDLPKRFSLDFDYRYESALPGLQIGSYATADTRVGWNFSRQWEVSVNGRNLLQPNHVEFASDPGPNVAINRSVYAKLVWRNREN